jgi:hypothetical protein
MREGKNDDVRRFGAIDLATLQRHINFHYWVARPVRLGSRQRRNFYTRWALALGGKEA